MEEERRVVPPPTARSSRGKIAASAGAVLVALAAMAAAGCSNSAERAAGDKPPAKPAPDKSAENGGPAPARPTTAALTLEPIDKDAYEKFLQKHHGKVILVDFWATWCLPCVELLPHTAEVARKWGDEGLVVATISLDDPDMEAQVRRVLASKGMAAVENFLAKPAMPDEPMSDPFVVFEIPGGAVPHFKLYAADGKLARTFDSEKETIDTAKIDAALEELLKRRGR